MSIKALKWFKLKQIKLIKMSHNFITVDRKTDRGLRT